VSAAVVGITAAELRSLARYRFTPDTEVCPVCGAAGPCSVDDAGRPLVHTDAELLRGDS
jgi:hypothetical protein